MAKRHPFKKVLQNDVVNIDERIKQIEAKIKNPEKLHLGLEKFSNSLNSLINRLKKEISLAFGYSLPKGRTKRTFWSEIWFRTLKLMHKKG